MFADANFKARQYTRPVVTSVALANGKVVSSIGAFVVLNDEGWILTAWHIISAFGDLTARQQKHTDFIRARQAIEDDASLNAHLKSKALKKLRLDSDAVQAFSYWWGGDGATITDVHAITEVDLAVGRLEPFDPDSVRVYPRIKDPGKPMLPGTSLCKLGFPFHSIEPIFDPVLGAFSLPVGSVPPPFFPIDGILTRNVEEGRHPQGYRLAYIETSSPGLRGQSGGPTFDTQGTIWGIQSKTAFYPLGFSPEVKDEKGKTHVEHQFLNAGLGVHAETVVGLLREIGIKHELSDY